MTTLAVSPAFAGKLYKWVDEAGNVSYQDRPPPSGQGRVEERELRVRGGTGGGDPAMAEAASKAPITLYVVPRCSSCDAARQHLKTRGVPFSEIDVSEKNIEAQQQMRQKVGELSVPTIVVGSKVMKGYMDSLLDGELEAAGYPKPQSPEGEAPAEGEAAPQQ